MVSSYSWLPLRSPTLIPHYPNFLIHLLLISFAFLHHVSQWPVNLAALQNPDVQATHTPGQRHHDLSVEPDIASLKFLSR